jgi:hydroxymethylpyrimidine kinase / phosphomethylpyrimidine kinase / thiamine-phosphate diphosphorylase
LDSIALLQNIWPEEQRDLPYLSPQPLLHPPKPFKQCALGLYPVVESSSWVLQLVQQGVTCIQLRMKDVPKQRMHDEIKRSVAITKKFGARLFLNDYWELAIHFGVDGVHLGQEDLEEADIDRIYDAGLYLGLSTHCYYEVARAHAINPSYIACGPIYPTTSKDMAFSAQGREQLQRWRRTLNYPLVAIGGITLERLPEVLNTGVDGVALISTITKAADPLGVTQSLLKQIEEFRHAAPLVV